MNINDDKFNNLRLQFENSTQTKIVMMSGEKGLGKTEVINRFIKDKHQVVKVNSLYNSTYALEPIIQGINLYNEKTNKSFFSDKHYLKFNNNLNFNEEVSKMLIDICSKNRMIIVFESINNYSIDLLLFTRQLIRGLYNNCADMNVFILIEIDSDDVKDVLHTDIIDSFYSITPNLNFINFKRFNNVILEEYFLKTFDSNIEIEDADLNYIISSSFGNLMYLTIIINYLKQMDVITLNKNGWKCKSVEKGSFIQILKKNILSRYDKLEPSLKAIIQKSSIVGFEFDQKILLTIFKIIKANEYLSQIEKASKLIIENNYGGYHFENYEVYSSINSFIQEDDKIQWNSILAQYYEEKLKKNIQISDELRFNIGYGNYLYKAAMHYEKGMNFYKALNFYLRLQTFYKNIMDYNSSLEIIEKVTELNDMLDQDNQISYMMVFQKSEINNLMGNFNNAYLGYMQVLDNYGYLLDSDETNNINYQIAFCLYMNGNFKDSLNNLLLLKNKIENCKQNTPLLYKIYSLISSIYDEMGEYDESTKHYNWSVQQCKNNGLEKEYYIQLRKSSMVIDIKIAEPLMLTAANYFKETRDIKEYAKTLHNLGTDNIYKGDFESASNYIKESISVFKTYGSRDIHCSLNTMGIIEFIYNNDPVKALQYFSEAFSNDYEDYSKVTIWVNMAACYRETGDFEKAREVNEKIENCLNKEINNIINDFEVYQGISKGLYFQMIGDSLSARENFQKCIGKKNIRDRYLKLASLYLRDNLIAKNVVIPEILTKNCNIISEELVEFYYKKQTFFCTLRFYE